MATVKEIFDGRDGEAELGGKGNEGAKRRYTRVFQVFTDDPEHDALVVMFLPEIPRLTDRYVTARSTDLGALCRRVNPVQQADDRTHWKVTCEYSSDSREAGDPSKEISGGNSKDGGAEKGNKDSDKQNDPLQQPAKIQIGAERYVKPIWKDIKGVAITNSVGESFDPPLEVEDFRTLITVTKRVAAHDPLAPINRVAINSDTFMGFPPGTVKQVEVNAQEEFDQGIRFAEVTRTFLVDPEGWQIQPLDLGFKAFDPASGEIREIMMRGDDGRKRKISTPHPLDGNRNKVEPPGKPAILKFDVYNQLPFSGLER